MATNMNPARDNEFAAQERVFQLEKELAEKNKLIYKLKNPTPKKEKSPRQPINWPAWLKKTVKISAWTVGGTIFLLFCISLFECNETYITKGKITKVLDKAHKYKGDCPLIPDKKSRLYKPDWCKEQKISETGYGIEVEFLFQNQKRIERFGPFESTMGGRYLSWPETAKNPLESYYSGYYRVHSGEAVPHVGCIVNVYYPLGVVFKDRTWPPKFLIDASMCKKPPLAEDTSGLSRGF